MNERPRQLRPLADLNPNVDVGPNDVHAGHVNSLAWSRDGLLLAAGGFAGGVRIWDVSQRTLARFDSAHRDEVVTLGWSADQSLVSVDVSGHVLQRFPRGDEVPRVVVDLEDGGDVYNAALSPDGSRLAVGSEVVTVIDLGRSGSALELDSYSDWLTRVRWAPDGKHLAAHGGSRVVVIWDGSREITLDSDARACSWSTDSSRLAVISVDDEVCVWDARSGSLVARWAAHGSPNEIFWSGPVILTVGSEGLSVFSPEDPDSVRRAPVPSIDMVLAYALCHDGRRFAMVDADADGAVWEISSLSVTDTFSLPDCAPTVTAWSFDDRSLAVGCANGRVIVVG